MKKIELEKKVWNFIDNNINYIFIIIISICSLLIRMLLIKHQSGDYITFLRPWFNELKLYGGISALSRNIGNYTPIYMTVLALFTYLPIDSLISIKVFSIIFDYIGALAIAKIVLELFKDKKYCEKLSLIVFSIYLFLPTVFFNSSYWGQCDSIYSAFVLISLLYLIKKDFVKGIIFWSIAFAFKFQAIFIFPLYVLMYIANRKIKFKYFLIIPLIVFILSIPKVIFSHNIFSGFEVYLNQSSEYKYYATLNFPNVYSIFLTSNKTNYNLISAPFREMGTIGVIITFVILVIIAYIVYLKKIKFDNQTIIDFALWSILITTFFLPQMHERYLFMGDVIGLVYLLLHKDKFYIPIIIEFISLNGYMICLFLNYTINFSLLSIVFLIMLIIYSKDMYDRYFKIN